MFLQILGIIFLIVIFVIAYYVWKFYRHVKRQTNSDLSIAMTVLPYQDMELEPSNKEEWQEKEQLAYSESELKSIGATHVGYYCVYNGYAIIRISIWNCKDQAIALFYEGCSELDKNNVNFIYEVAVRLDDGSICITSNPHAVYENRPSNHPIIFNESKSIIDFINLLNSEIPDNNKIININDPKEFFTECYEVIAEWSWKPEQLSNNKTQQTLSSVGVDVTEELMQELIEMGENYSLEVNIRRARRAFAEQTEMTADQWEAIRDKLVFINENMKADHLIEAVYELGGELTEMQEKVLNGFQANTNDLIDPIGAFQMLMQSLNLKAKRVTSIDTPVKTEVYLPL